MSHRRCRPGSWRHRLHLDLRKANGFIAYTPRRKDQIAALCCRVPGRWMPGHVGAAAVTDQLKGRVLRTIPGQLAVSR